MIDDDGPTCPDYPPEFGELSTESLPRSWPATVEAFYWGANRLAMIDQQQEALAEFARRYASRPVIVGTWTRSAWYDDAHARILSANAPGWLGVDPEVERALMCDHLQISPRPAFRWAPYPWWRFCADCHYGLLTWDILADGLRCRRCRRALTSDTMFNRALLFTSELLMAAVCQPCARLFDRVEPRAVNAPAPGTALYAARTYDSGTVEEFTAELRAAGVIKEEQGDPDQ